MKTKQELLNHLLWFIEDAEDDMIDEYHPGNWFFNGLGREDKETLGKWFSKDFLTEGSPDVWGITPTAFLQAVKDVYEEESQREIEE